MSADREQLERAIQAQESLRGTLGDEMVEAVPGIVAYLKTLLDDRKG